MLSDRLKTIYDMIDNSAAVADIGTDHGYLPIQLIKGKKCNTVYACDIKEKPLNTACQNIKAANVGGIITLKSDGLKNIDKNAVDTVVIAGMGGKTIVDILSACEWISDKKYTLILQPMTSPELLRSFLIKNGFEFINEAAVLDNGKPYSVIKVRFSGIKKEYPDGFEYTGLLKCQNEASNLYINKQYKRICDMMSNIKDTNKRSEFIRIEKYIKSLTEK